MEVVRIQFATMEPQRALWWHAALAVQSDRALERRNLMIDGMFAAEAISQLDADRAKLSRLPSFKTDKQ